MNAPGAWSGIDVATRRRQSRQREQDRRRGAEQAVSAMEYEFRLGLAGGGDDPAADPATGPAGAASGTVGSGAGAEARTAVGAGAGSDFGTGAAPGPPAVGERIPVTARLLEILGASAETCVRCHHTFRLGEEVDVSRRPDGDDSVLRHAGGLLDCTEAGTADPAADSMAAQFHQGLDEANPPPAGLHPVRLTAGHRLLALHPGTDDRPPTRFTCWVCDMTLRPGELVIHCTCSPEDPLCTSAVHRDSDRGLVCYDDWKNKHGAVPCLMMNSPRDVG